MRRAGYVLLAVSFVMGLLLWSSDFEVLSLTIAFSVTLIASLAILIFDFVTKFRIGQIQFRLIDAIKRFAILLPFMMALHFIFYQLGWSDKSLNYAILHASILAGVMAIYSTVYRKRSA